MRIGYAATMAPVTCALATFALAAFSAGAAQAGDFRPKSRGTTVAHVRITDVSPSGSDAITTLAGGATGLRAEVGGDVMPTLGLTRFLTDHVAVEVIAGTTKHTVTARGAGVDLRVKETWVLPPVVAIQYHFAPDRRVSPYLGAGVNYMLFYNGSDKNGFDLKLDDGFGVALQAGVDVAASGPWSLNLDVKKVFFETDAVDRANGVRSKVRLDPWVVSGGLGYRF